MSTKAEREAEKAHAIEYLKKLLKPGDYVWTNTQHVSQSGMYRAISVHIVAEEGIRNITGSAALAMGSRYDRKHYGVGMGGVGMDMGFSLVYSLSHSLWPGKVRCTGKEDTCRSNDHFNERGNTRYDGRRWHKDSGYALKQRWL